MNEKKLKLLNQNFCLPRKAKKAYIKRRGREPYLAYTKDKNHQVLSQRNFPFPYFMFKNGRILRTNDLLEWAFYFETDERIIQKTRISPTPVNWPFGDKDILVSTIFLGLSAHSNRLPRQLFETMIFGLPDDCEHGEYQVRADTLAEAKQQHREAVEYVKHKLNSL